MFLFINVKEGVFVVVVDFGDFEMSVVDVVIGVGVIKFIVLGSVNLNLINIMYVEKFCIGIVLFIVVFGNS